MSIIQFRITLYALAAGLLVFTLNGCVSLHPVVTGDFTQLQKPGALIELQTVRNASGQKFDFDVEGMLHTAMQVALQDEHLEWTSGSTHYHFILDLKIAEYQPAMPSSDGYGLDMAVLY